MKIRNLSAILLGVPLLGAAPLAVPPAMTATGSAEAPSPQRKLFVFLYRPGPEWVEGRPMSEQKLRPHGSYFAALLRDGRVFAGGGFVNRDGGMAIVRAADMNEARTILERDPAISGGVFAAEVHEWSPRFHSTDPLIERPH